MQCFGSSKFVVLKVGMRPNLKQAILFFIFAFRLLFEEHVAKYVQVVEMSYLQVVTISWVSGGEGGGR